MVTETLFELADFEPKPIYTGIAPLNFTTDYFHPDDFAAADSWLRDVEGLHFGSAVGRIHTWQRGTTTGWVVPEGEARHNLCLLTCCLDCFDYPAHDIDRSREHGETLRTCSCIQLSLDQAVCTACRWHHIADSENECVEAWHDHTWPGWRELPILPDELRGKMGTGTMTAKLETWFAANYPADFRVPGAPILTRRGKWGTRHVPGYSPYGGYDLSANDLPRTESNQ